MTIVFTGMMMIVRHGSPSSADILAVQPKAGMAHQPRLAVPLESVSSISKGLLSDVITDPQGRVFGIVDLTGKKLTLKNATGAPLSFHMQSDVKDFHQVPDFDTIWKPNDPFIAKPPVTAEIRLDRGELVVSSRAEDPPGLPMRVTIGPKVTMKSVAEVVEWKADGTVFSISIEPGKKSIVFKGGKAEAAISNLPKDPLEELSSGRSDFGGYYDLFKDGSNVPAAQRHIPVQVQQPGKNRVGIACVTVKCFMATVSR